MTWRRMLQEAPPRNYRINLAIRDPAIKAWLWRVVPYGSVTSMANRLLREGFDHMVGTGKLDLATFLSPDEIELLRKGRRGELASQFAAAGATADAAVATATAQVKPNG